MTADTWTFPYPALLWILGALVDAALGVVVGYLLATRLARRRDRITRLE